MLCLPFLSGHQPNETKAYFDDSFNLNYFLPPAAANLRPQHEHLGRVQFQHSQDTPAFKTRCRSGGALQTCWCPVPHSLGLLLNLLIAIVDSDLHKPFLVQGIGSAPESAGA